MNEQIRNYNKKAIAWSASALVPFYFMLSLLVALIAAQAGHPVIGIVARKFVPLAERMPGVGMWEVFMDLSVSGSTSQATFFAPVIAMAVLTVIFVLLLRHGFSLKQRANKLVAKQARNRAIASDEAIRIRTRKAMSSTTQPQTIR